LPAIDAQFRPFTRRHAVRLIIKHRRSGAIIYFFTDFRTVIAMPGLKEDSGLFEISAALIREWHPSANGRLTPRNLTAAYSEKIWWLCEEGHEWQATIQCRMEGEGCPRCQKWIPEPGYMDLGPDHPNTARKESQIHVKTEKPEINIDRDEGPIILGKNFRKGRRFKRKAIAVLEVADTGYWVYAEMKNISRNGLCFETEAAIQPGTRLAIKFDRSSISAEKKGYLSYGGVIRWCKKLEDETPSVSNYSCGVQFIRRK
jgi:hypothetical protein